MSENEAIFFKLDMQPAIAALVLSNGGRCAGDEGAWVSCDGEAGCFPGTPCPLEGMLSRGIPCPCWSTEQRAVAAKEWLKKYHRQKAKAAQKQELDATERIAQLEKDNAKAQALRDEAIKKYSTLVLQYSKLADDYVSFTDKHVACREKAGSLEKERIKLQKENAELQSTHARLRKELVWQFEQLTKKVGTLQDQNDQLLKELAAAKRAENDSRLCWNKEHERMLQRIKELKTELSEHNQFPRPRFFL